MMDKTQIGKGIAILQQIYSEIDGIQYYVELYGHCVVCDGTGMDGDVICDDCDSLGVVFDYDNNVGVCLCGRETVNISHSYFTCTRCDSSRQLRKPERNNYPDRYERPLL